MKPENLLEDWSSVKKFQDREVKKEEIERVFELTTKAPTAFNLQPYRFTVLDSEKAFQKALDSIPDVNKWIGHADKIVVLIGFEDIDRNAHDVHQKKMESGEIDEEESENLMKMYADYKTRDEDFLTGWLTRNTMIPATFFMIACKTQGIGTCPVRGFNQERLGEKLDLEDSERPILLMPIGYPKGEGDRHWRRKGQDIFEIE
jgi:Nitroreductase